MCGLVTNLATIQTDTINKEPFLGTIEIISTHSKKNQWMIELLLNGKQIQVKIDTGADVTAISEQYSGNWMGLRETGKSLHGPAKQPPANNAWTIHWHANISTIKHMSRDFCSS